ncbi:MAG: IS1634 family transposase [Waddliaceae bacterium]
MAKISQEGIRTAAMDHHGLVAALCHDLKIAERIDRRLAPDHQRKVSPGIASIAMIINGLGFTNRTLYLTHRFFESKPIERLLGRGLKPKDLTDHTLARALDDIAEYGASKLFAEVAFEVAQDHNLLSMTNHLDTTSLSVHGEYDVEDNSEVIEVTHGFSKDHRPDLKQVVLSLVVNGPSAIPLWMDPLDGNSSDKTSFHETVKQVERFRAQIGLNGHFKWIADSALYTKERLLKNNDYCWVTRVPETIVEARKLVEKPSEDISWIGLDGGYRLSKFESSYGGITQRWLLVFSEQAYNREKKTLEKKIVKEGEKLKQELWHFGNKIFHCEKDAIEALETIGKGYKLHKIKGKLVALSKHVGRGRPKKDAEKVELGYKVATSFERDAVHIEKLLNRKGRFILATNDLDIEGYKDEDILEEYKEQQDVERGFRFLKDPWFMVDEIFLKLPKRIEALMMIMTLTLLVYNVGQYLLRENLKKEETTLPNQLGKQIQNPTLRWIFQIMEGVGVVQFYDEMLSQVVQELITNLDALRRKIITLFGETAMKLYGLIPKKLTQGVEM